MEKYLPKQKKNYYDFILIGDSIKKKILLIGNKIRWDYIFYYLLYVSK